MLTRVNILSKKITISPYRNDTPNTFTVQKIGRFSMLSEFDNRGQDVIAERLRAINDARFDGCQNFSAHFFRRARIVVHDSSRDSNDFGDFYCDHFFLNTCSMIAI